MLHFVFIIYDEPYSASVSERESDTRHIEKCMQDVQKHAIVSIVVKHHEKAGKMLQQYVRVWKCVQKFAKV